MTSPVKEYQSFEHFMREAGQPPAITSPVAAQSSIANFAERIAQKIQTDIAPSITANSFDIGSYWPVLPTIGFGLSIWSHNSWMTYALTGLAAQVCDTQVAQQQISTVTKVATGIFGLHAVMGAYNIVLANTYPTYENILRIVFDAMYIVKTASIITNLTPAKNE